MAVKSGAKSILINSKKRKTSRESNKNNKVYSQRCSRDKNNERVENPKIKGFITLQNILFLKESLKNKGMTSFNKIFQQSTTTRYQNTRSTSDFQLRKHDFKTKKYGRFSIVNKCLSDWNQLQKHLKINFKDIERSELKTIVTNHLLKQYIT